STPFFIVLLLSQQLHSVKYVFSLIFMNKRYKFNKVILSSIIGGKSILDLPRLNIGTFPNAHRFISSYGYDFECADELEQAWAIYDRVLDLMTTYILEDKSELPDLLSS